MVAAALQRRGFLAALGGSLAGTARNTFLADESERAHRPPRQPSPRGSTAAVSEVGLPTARRFISERTGLDEELALQPHRLHRRATDAATEALSRGRTEGLAHAGGTEQLDQHHALLHDRRFRPASG